MTLTRDDALERAVSAIEACLPQSVGKPTYRFGRVKISEPLRAELKAALYDVVRAVLAEEAWK